MCHTEGVEDGAGVFDGAAEEVIEGDGERVGITSGSEVVAVVFGARDVGS